MLKQIIPTYHTGLLNKNKLLVPREEPAVGISTQRRYRIAISGTLAVRVLAALQLQRLSKRQLQRMLDCSYAGVQNAMQQLQQAGKVRPHGSRSTRTSAGLKARPETLWEKI